MSQTQRINAQEVNVKLIRRRELDNKITTFKKKKRKKEEEENWRTKAFCKAIKHKNSMTMDFGIPQLRTPRT